MLSLVLPINKITFKNTYIFTGQNEISGFVITDIQSIITEFDILYLVVRFKFLSLWINPLNIFAGTKIFR